MSFLFPFFLFLEIFQLKSLVFIFCLFQVCLLSPRPLSIRITYTWFLSSIQGWYTLPRQTCVYCFKSYASKKGLDRHKKFECYMLPPKEKFKCPYCSHESKRKDNLRQHMFKHFKQSKNPVRIESC